MTEPNEILTSNKLLSMFKFDFNLPCNKYVKKSIELVINVWCAFVIVSIRSNHIFVLSIYQFVI